MSKLEKFNLDSLSFLTEVDELDLRSMGERKVALFALIPDNDTSFNFLVSILCTQLFQQLFYVADHIYGGSLPVPVHFMMDEFANVALPDDFEKILSVMRSRNVSVSIILQNLSQLKALFEKQWESIVGNCDEFIYLGGNEQSTHKYVSELIGKETIDTNSFGKSDGMRGNFSTNYQLAGRELLTPDEVRMLDNRYAIVLIRGERPVMDVKYDILGHPNISLSAIGGGEVYRHGKECLAACGITIVNLADYPGTSIVYRDYLLRGCVGDAPTMKAFYDTLLAQDELEAKELALALELYINGNLNIFAKPTNVNLQSRLVCYDIHGLGEELMSPSMRIVLDSIYNRVIANKAKGRKTYIFIDEIYILFAHEHSAQFLHKLWRRVRKAGGYVIGVTQNVEDLLDSPTAKFMLANSEYVIMLNQAATDRMRLAEVMKISESQMAYFTNTEAGHGLAKIGGTFVPFVNRLPKDTELYRMMTTKFGE